MKKNAPIIIAAAILLFIFFKRKGANPLSKAGGSANQADNAKRAAPLKQSSNSGLLNSLLGAGSNILGRVLPSLLSGRGGGGSGGGTGGGLSLGKPSGSGNDSGGRGGGGGGSPTSGGSGSGSDPEQQTTLDWEKGTFNPFDNPSDPGNELYGGAPPFEGYTGRDLTLSDRSPGTEFDYGGEFTHDQSSLTNANDYQAFDNNSFLWSPNYSEVSGEITNPLTVDFAGTGSAPAFTDWTTSYGYTDTMPFANDAGVSDPYANDPYIDPFSSFDFTDPFANFYDFSNFDYASGGTTDSGGGGGGEKSYATGGGGGGGGGGSYATGGSYNGVPISYYPGYGQ